LFSVGLLRFVGFVVNLLNRPTDGATVNVRKVRPKKCVRKSGYEKVRPKKSYFPSAWEYVKQAFSLRVQKNNIMRSNEKGKPFRTV
jgi:hypothetical protein